MPTVIYNFGVSDAAAPAELRAFRAYLEGLSGNVDAIRAASNALEPDPPNDYTDDFYWPPLP